MRRSRKPLVQFGVECDRLEVDVVLCSVVASGRGLGLGVAVAQGWLSMTRLFTACMYSAAPGELFLVSRPVQLAPVRQPASYCSNQQLVQLVPI